MDGVEFTYRLPSMVVVQRDPIPPLDLEVDGWQVVVHEPGHEPGLSHPGEWNVSFENPRRRYGDMLRIDLLLPPSLDQYPRRTSAMLPQLDAVAQTCAKQLATLLPVEAGQFWIGHQPSPLPWFRMAVRMSMVRDDGLATYLGSETVEPTVDKRWWLTTEAWTRIGEQLRTQTEPPLPRVLLYEALAFQFGGNMRLSVLSCAMACEIALKTYIREVHGAREPLNAYIVDRDRDLSILDYLNDVLKLATGKEAKVLLEQDVGGQKMGYLQLRRLFEARNRVVHRGRAYYVSDSGKTEVALTDEVMGVFITSARLLLDWLDNLRRIASASS